MNKGLNNKTVTTCTNKAQNNIVCMKTNCTYIATVIAIVLILYFDFLHLKTLKANRIFILHTKKTKF